MNNFFTNILISTILFLIILTFIILNIYNDKDDKIIIDNEDIHNEKKQYKIYLLAYDFIVLVFLFILSCFIFYNGYSKGLIKTLFIWAFLITITPIPEAGLLITLPLKKYANLSLHYSHFISSIFGLFILYYFYFNENKIVNENYIGKVFHLIIYYNFYLIILVSIISSTLISLLLDNFIDKIILEKEISYLNQKIVLICFFILLYIYHYRKLINYK